MTMPQPEDKIKDDFMVPINDFNAEQTRINSGLKKGEYLEVIGISPDATKIRVQIKQKPEAKIDELQDTSRDGLC